MKYLLLACILLNTPNALSSDAQKAEFGPIVARCSLPGTVAELYSPEVIAEMLVRDGYLGTASTRIYLSTGEVIPVNGTAHVRGDGDPFRDPLEFSMRGRSRDGVEITATLHSQGRVYSYALILGTVHYSCQNVIQTN